MRNICSDNRGAVMLELALMLPIFLAFLMLFYWFGLLMQGRETLFQSLGQSVHLAKTRGNFLEMGFDPNDPSSRGLVRSVDQFYDGVGNSFGPRLRELLSTEDIRSYGISIEQQYLSFLTEACETREDPKDGSTYTACFYPSGTALKALPREAWYAMVYLSNSLKQSLGSLVRFPCDPTIDQTESTPGGAGCVKCRFMPLIELGLDGCEVSGSGCEHLLNAAGVPRDRFGIECYYRFPEFFFRPILSLVGVGIDEWEQGVTVYAKEWSLRELGSFCLADEEYCNY